MKTPVKIYSALPTLISEHLLGNNLHWLKLQSMMENLWEKQANPRRK